MRVELVIICPQESSTESTTCQIGEIRFHMRPLRDAAACALTVTPERGRRRSLPLKTRMSAAGKATSGDERVLNTSLQRDNKTTWPFSSQLTGRGELICDADTRVHL